MTYEEAGMTYEEAGMIWEVEDDHFLSHSRESGPPAYAGLTYRNLETRHNDSCSNFSGTPLPWCGFARYSEHLKNNKGHKWNSGFR